MGYAYLGLGLGGVVAPLLVNYLIRNCGWRHSFEILGVVIMLVLIPVGIGVTRSTPADLGLLPDGADHAVVASNNGPVTAGAFEVKSAIRSRNFWLIMAGSTLVVSAIAAVTQHFILFVHHYGIFPWPVGAPWIAGRIFDALHSYELAWNIIAMAGLVGAAAIFAVSPKSDKKLPS
jgi:MFS family permease